MSDPGLIDLKQATLGALLQRLGELTQAIVTGNNRYDRLASELVRVDSHLSEQMIGLRQSIANLHSDIISQANQIITLQHDVLRLLQKDQET